MPAFSLQICSIDDTAQIAALASSVWHQHYLSIISQEQINYMLSTMYSHQSLLEQMQEKQHLFYFIVQNENAVGFISIHQTATGDWFLNKFYIDQSKAAQGLGTAALQELENRHKIKCIQLTVNRQNFKSINFYFKNGFKIKEVADFDIGNGYFMNDFVMEKVVK